MKIVIFMITPILLFGQQKGLPEGQAVSSEKFRLSYKFGLNIFHNYIFSEESKIIRTDLKTKKEKTFNRKVQVFITLRQNTLPENGFNTVKVSFDSLRYELVTDDGKRYYYNSQDEETVSPYSTNEFYNYTILLGKEYYLTYSPYNEVVKIFGEMLDTLRNKINHPEDGIKDPELKFVWDRLFQPSYQKLIPDLAKNLIPEYVVSKTDVWKRFFDIFVDGVVLSDTAEVKLIEFSPKEYVISAELKNLRGAKTKNNVYGISELVDIDNIKGNGTMKMTVLPRGVIKESEFDAKFEYEFEYDEVPYKQSVETKYFWNLDKMYR
ncbi:MAG: hypothetical protein N3A67_01930 [Ignavibacteria bacterium]|nr:hypothetical protein [Ignavibacteria bacterium]